MGVQVRDNTSTHEAKTQVQEAQRERCWDVPGLQLPATLVVGSATVIGRYFGREQAPNVHLPRPAPRNRTPPKKLVQEQRRYTRGLGEMVGAALVHYLQHLTRTRLQLRSDV